MTELKSITPVSYRACEPTDVTPPPKPELRVAIATGGAAGDNAYLTRDGVNATVPRTDPVYLEIGNYEAGTAFQLISYSKDSHASFDNAADIINLKPTGRDIKGRVAGIWIDEETLAKLRLNGEDGGADASGVKFMLRAVDTAGNVSEAVRGTFEGSNWSGIAREGTVHDPSTNERFSGGEISLLDGEGRRLMYLRKLNDTTAPNLKWFEESIQLSKDEKGELSFKSSRGLEPDATIRILNTRTGEIHEVTVDQERNSATSLGSNNAAGDNFIFEVRDRAGNTTRPLEIRYSDTCKDGKASKLGILAARLDPVIKRAAAK